MWEKIKYKYWSIVPYNWRPGQIWYRLKCWAWYRYTTIKPRTLKHNTWTDRSCLLPHFMFEILIAFIEKECSPGHIEWYGGIGHKIVVDGKEKYVRDEMQDLYNWWQGIDLECPFELFDKDLREQYEKNWARIEKISKPFSSPINDDLWEWNPGVEEKDEEEYSRLIKENREIQKQDQELLISNMQRLCKLQPYLWT